VLELGNPPSKIIVENNVFQTSYQYGGGAILVQAGRSDGASTILVRNNVFNPHYSSCTQF
jgi:hypothetical protein